MRERRQGPYAAHFEQQLPIARDSRGYAGCELPTESLPIGSHRLFSSDDGREIGRTIFGTPSRPATGLRFCPRVGRHGSLRAENGLNGKGGFKEGASPPSRPATGLRFCPRVGRHGSLRAENGLNGKGGFKEGASPAPPPGQQRDSVFVRG
jgi:hypothetical protein